ncbi:hypothetical protein ONZ45_g8271 [Pleurotus djamor]|nr:hypothetical protein ONZ45_g16658 [Pleurotus djamor]KAJ8514130.1 hypothetical protein ONZ45_g8271 [Pleurotus djamor]
MDASSYLDPTVFNFDSLLQCETGRIYDYFLTLPLEISLVWSKPFQGFAGVLFLLNRYLPFIDIPLSVYNKLAYGLTSHQYSVNDNVVAAFLCFGIFLSELYMVLRVWILWGRSRTITWFLVALAVSGVIVVAASFSAQRSSVEFIPLSVIGLPGWYPRGGNQLKQLGYFTVMIVEFVILFLTVLRYFQNSHHRRWIRLSPTTWMDLLVRDGMMYYIFLTG